MVGGRWSFGFLGLAVSMSACAEVPVEAPPPDFVAVGGPPNPNNGVNWVDVCHLGPNGVFIPQSVNANSLNAHLGHGDLRYAVAIPTGAAFSASVSIVGNPLFTPDRLPRLAFDGNFALGWNAGDFPPQWIE